MASNQLGPAPAPALSFAEVLEQLIAAVVEFYPQLRAQIPESYPVEAPEDINKLPGGPLNRSAKRVTFNRASRACPLSLAVIAPRGRAQLCGG